MKDGDPTWNPEDEKPASDRFLEMLTEYLKQAGPFTPPEPVPLRAIPAGFYRALSDQQAIAELCIALLERRGGVLELGPATELAHEKFIDDLVGSASDIWLKCGAAAILVADELESMTALNARGKLDAAGLGMGTYAKAPTEKGLSDARD